MFFKDECNARKKRIMKAMKQMRDSAPGEDGVRIRHIRKAYEDVKVGVVKIIQKMFECRADK